MSFSKYLSIILTVLFFSATAFGGGGDRNRISDAYTLSLNGIYLNGNKGAFSLIDNPAALSYLTGSAFQLNITDRSGQQQFTNTGGELHQSFREDDFILAVGYSMKISDALTLSAGYMPYSNYNVRWPFATLKQDSTSSMIMSFDYENLTTADVIAAGGSYDLGMLSVGASVNIYRVNQKLLFPRDNPLWSADSGLAAYQVEYNTSAWAYGFTFGISAEPLKDIKAAVSVRSGFTADMEGTAKSSLFKGVFVSGVETDINYTYEMPWVVSGGILWKINNNMRLNFDFEYNLWSSIEENYNINFSDSTWQDVMNNVDTSYGLKGSDFSSRYDNAGSIGVGFEYLSGSGISYRAGYRYSQTPNKYAVFNMLFSDVNEHWISAGVGITSEKFHFDFTAALAFGVETEISKGNYRAAMGTYNSSLFIPSVNIKYSF